MKSQYNQIYGRNPAELIERMYNDSEGPAARMIAFRDGVRATLDALGVKYTHLKIVQRITIDSGA